MSVRSLCLLGRDYPELGQLAHASLPDGGAIALTRGAEPKAYAHEDPNEDGALLARTDEGTLLAIADGYNGVAASEIALGSARERAAALIHSGGCDFQRAVRELLDEIEPRLRDAGRSRTCLILAVLRGRGVEVACFGDSSLFRASDGQPVTPSNELVLGVRPIDAAADAKLWYASFDRQPGERVALVSDGVTNFIRRLEQISALLGEARDDSSAASAVARAAMRDGAGDNIAVATIAPDGE